MAQSYELNSEAPKKRKKISLLRLSSLFFVRLFLRVRKKNYLCGVNRDRIRKKKQKLMDVAPVIRLRGQLMDLARPRVMGIVNVTPDSFFPASRVEGQEEVVRRARQLVDEGADILDLGACSTRPGSTPVSEDEEWQRLAPALEAIRRELPEVPVSVDTFRASIARRSVLDFGADIINDISAGDLDPQMFPTVAELSVPYVLTHNAPFSPSVSAEGPVDGSLSAVASEDVPSLLSSVARHLAERLQQLYALGVADVILDPGFGFGKTLEQNYALLHHLHDLMTAFPGTPLLVGISRKSMIHRLLDITPDEALNGTTVLNTLALQSGAHILRVHDVRPAVEAIRIFMAYGADGVNGPL